MLSPPHRRRCNYSGCIPETIPTLPKPPPPPKTNANIPRGKRLSKIPKSHGAERLLEFQRTIWRQVDKALTSFLPPEAFLPSDLFKRILDSYATLDSIDAVGTLLKSHTHLDNSHQQLLDSLRALKPEFAKIAADRKTELAAARAQKKAVVVVSQSKDTNSKTEEREEEDAEAIEVQQPRYHLRGLSWLKLPPPIFFRSVVAMPAMGPAQQAQEMYVSILSLLRRSLSQV